MQFRFNFQKKIILYCLDNHRDHVLSIVVSISNENNAEKKNVLF